MESHTFSETSVQEFATRVLFGTSLEEKLAPPLKGLTIDPPHKKAIVSPNLPGRPQHLVPSKEITKPHKLADIGQVETDPERTRLLHAFANHELVAVELMALALLKFPDAPNAFRRGLLHTLQEEQQHTRWYLARLDQLGATFGQHPLSDMIWKHISTMSSPLEYVSRLSLTFEQANLDYAHHYSKILHQVGDEKSSRILHKIYQDEISHVGYGLHWLRNFKKESESDWDAWHRSLAAPLNPIRAKGNLPNHEFNESARRQAGLDDDFINRLKLHQSSRGRSPDLWFYNPDAEAELAAHKIEGSYQPPQRLNELAADLELAFHLGVSTQDDLLLLRRLPSENHRRTLNEKNLTLPEALLLNDPSLPERKFRSLQAWAPTPSTSNLANTLPKLPPSNYASTPLHSKAHTLELRNLLEQIPSLPQKTKAPPAFLCHNLADLIAAQENLHALGYTTLVLKETLSAAGRGIHLLQKNNPASDFRQPEDQLPRPLKRILYGIQKSPVLLEPWLDKVLEFSLHYHTNHHTPDRPLRHLGITTQNTSPSGTWLSSTSAIKLTLPTDSPHHKALAKTLFQTALPLAKEQLHNALTELITTHRYGIDQSLPLSIDSFLYQDPLTQEILYQPIVELNPRWTMGRVTHNLRQRLFPNSAQSVRLSTLSKKEALLTDSPNKILLSDPQQAHKRVPLLEIIEHT